MLTRWQSLLCSALGVAALTLVALNAGLFAANRAARATLVQRQQYVQQSVALQTLYGDIVKALAEAGARGNDREVLGLLAAQGLNVSVGNAGLRAPAPAAASGGPAAGGASAKR